MEGSTSESSCKESPVSQYSIMSVETQKDVISEPQEKKQHVGMTASQKKKIYKLNSLIERNGKLNILGSAAATLV